jgi:protein gp37
VIAGCESGPARRPAERLWFGALKNHCAGTGTNFFLKQMEIAGMIVKEPELDGQQWLQKPKMQR